MPALDADSPYDACRMAAFLGVHLVSQVLDEACTILTAAQHLGCPQTCVLSVFKDIKSGRLSLSSKEFLFGAPSNLNHEKIENEDQNDEDDEDNTNVVTSTPHEDEELKQISESSIIVQEDEEVEGSQEDLNKSTSMFINNLFDMSDVVKDDTPEEKGTDEIEFIDKVVLNNLVSEIMSGLFDTVADVTLENEIKDLEKTKSPDSCYSFLADAYEGYVGKDNAFYIDDDGLYSNDKPLEAGDMPDLTECVEVQNEVKEKNEAEKFENAYLTLNRDYEQCSDEDGDPILQDPKGLMMQDVELLPSTSEENLDSQRTTETEEARKQLAATSAISGASGSRKSRTSLVSRCRSQGARLLSCLRGWWRRKTPGKRKEGRSSGSVRGGVCPLSVEARRRIMDHHKLHSPLPSRSVVWKFNTINEAFVNSGRWKEYTFEMSTPCNEFC